MLTELRIRNFAIIDEIGLEFAEGFTVFTGETGAGKSILVDAVDLLVGGRASADLIRAGADEAEVSGVFSLTTGGPVATFLHEQDLLGSDESELILRRVLSREGRNRVHVNGRPTPLGVLQSLRGLLVDIHGQHEHQSLFKPAVQLDLLDEFGGLAAARTDYAGAFETWRGLETRLTERRGVLADRQTREDLLRYQVEEITGANLQAGEDRELERARLLLSQGRRLAELVQATYGPLYEEESSILQGLGGLTGSLKELATIDTELVEDRDRFAEALAQLTDLAQKLRAYRDRLEFDPDRLEKVEERLDLIRRLIKKYGGSLEEAVKLGEQAKRELQELESGDEALKELSQQVADAHAKVVKLAQALSRKRTKAAGELEKRLERELMDLRMEHARVRIAVEQETDSDGPKLTSAGMDRVEFLFSSNLGENPQPLARIASGGELSRVMLAMKTVLAEQDRVPVLVFDEVDAGIGGAVSEVVGKRLRHLSQHGHQVFCITHLAPIAAQAQRHFAVTKAAKSGRTVTQVATLDKAGRVEEVARMLGGEKITPTIRSTAAEMLKQK
ncbi:MAG TPA: DNA repair protein RecN [Nitrospirales bacterium]|nr:DNA repair protein RecN [Nitrospirales bacterium]